ncbi:hypothetical protein SAMN03159341_107105 [Paenibacillus sp. 1_12]|nr:hypothetical protein SAMN03159341_107105 [Paenibacillus sp. 1_12]
MYHSYSSPNEVYRDVGVWINTTVSELFNMRSELIDQRTRRAVTYVLSQVLPEKLDIVTPTPTL